MEHHVLDASLGFPSEAVIDAMPDVQSIGQTETIFS